ncbi:APA family basic amino acid/polyamine antiporter [Kribbella amoyensis]|uniref:APA family basic amino acid/polyamine antiporter n=1 Tax=Kribbella amoyensis TaxID=996641 RepID=A0A561B0T4_9ACTN|nr:amino acid permease [Kribbella amoyensis]TWD72479.1 APA family basic amino acid/polyamine antiporter [Kribbella amoyensis]
MAPSANGQTVGRRLPVESAFTRVEDARHRLPRLFGRRDLVVLGLGVMIGSGIFSLSGKQAATVAGPAVILSFVIAAIVCVLAAACYAELSSTIPVSGSAYTFSYVTFGEAWAWLVGWALVLELVTAAAIVARVWSAYFLATLNGFGVSIPAGLAQFFGPDAKVNLVAPLLLLLLTAMIVTGTKLSARVLTVVVLAKVAVIVLVVIIGATHIKPENFEPFVPMARAAPATASPTLLGWILDSSFGAFGVMGIFTAASSIVFAFIGFDLIATASEDARNPRKTVPQGMLLGVGAVTILYVAMAVVLVGLRPYAELGGGAPVSEALDTVGVGWAADVVNLGALLALMTVIMVVLIAQSRVLFNMGRDGLLPKSLGRVSRVYSSPARAATAAGLAAVALTLYPGVLDLEELLVIGALFCFAFCAIGVLRLRRTEPDLERGFRVPMVPLIPLLSLAATVWLMLNLKTSTWVKFGVWMLLGLAIYGLYGRWHSRLANEESWDFEVGDTDPGTGGLQAVRTSEPDPELRAVRTPPRPTRGKHMRN